MGTLPMRTVSRHAYDSKCPSVNPNVFNVGHTVPVDERLPLAETFCGKVSLANFISLYALRIAKLSSLVFLSAPFVLFML